MPAGLPRLVLAALLLAGALLAWLALLPGEPPPEVTRLTRASFIKSPAHMPPDAEGQPWEARSLPDFWRQHRPGDAGLGWYRLEFDVQYQPDTPWAAHVSFANSALALRLNGVEVARESAFDAAHLGARASPPHLLILPAPLLKPGRNQLDIQLRVERDINGGLSAVEIGPQEWLTPRFLAQRLWRIDLPRALTMSSLAIALFVALLWLRRPREMIYPWFCAAALLWGLRALYFTGDDAWLLPLRHLLGLNGNELFLAASLSLGFALLAILVNRFAGQRQPWLERLALALCIVLPLPVAPLGIQVLAPLQPAWYGLAVLFGGHAVYTAACFAWRRRHWSYWLILAGILAMALAGLHDWLVVTGRLAFDPIPWLGYGPPAMLAALVIALGDRYFQAFDEAARLNRDLEQRVRDKTLEIEHHYERIAQLERVAGIAEERDRLMREMHDGVGSQLITALHALEKGRLGPAATAELLRACIDDLRLMIDSLDASAHSMSDALANLRFRLEPRLAAAGIASTWQIDDAPLALPPGIVLQLLRILQEAATNTLKHAGASEMRIAWSVDAAARLALLRVADNGHGFTPSPGEASAGASAGRGLLNMRQRAERIGGALALLSGPDGTELLLSLALPVSLPPGSAP